MTLKTKMERMIVSSYPNIAGVVVLKQGSIAYENYFNACTGTDTVHIFSVTKSIVSILLGIAIDKGYIQSVNQKVLDFFPDYHVKKNEKTIQSITIRDIITMTAPYKYKEEPYAKYFSSDNWVDAALDSLGGTGRIGEFRYAPIIGPDILSGILVKATGQSVLEFAKENLFKPLGIQVGPSIIFQNKEEQLTFYKAKKTSGWVTDPKGVNTAGWGLSLSPMDMAKIGQLYLDGGRLLDRQLVSNKWVEESTKEHSRCDQFKMSYGYLWWRINDDAYAALGDGGNVIYVNEKKNQVVAIAAYFIPNTKKSLKLITEYIEPVF